jgi:hypothetical protein
LPKDDGDLLVESLLGRNGIAGSGPSILVPNLQAGTLRQTKTLMFNGKQIKAVLSNTNRENFHNRDSPAKEKQAGSLSIRKYRKNKSTVNFFFAKFLVGRKWGKHEALGFI